MATEQFKVLVQTIADRTGVEVLTIDNLEAFTELVLTQVCELILQSDPSPKLVVSEPYGTIMDNINSYFYEGKLPDGSDAEPGVIWE